MDKKYFINFLNKYHGVTASDLTTEDIIDIITTYCVGRGKGEKESRFFVEVAVPIIGSLLLEEVIKYYMRELNIIKVYKGFNPQQIILFY